MSDLDLGTIAMRLARHVFDQVLGGTTARAGGTAAPVPARPPEAGTPGLDRLLPPLVGAFPRTHLNDRFGGLAQGGVHASYDADGHPVRVLVRRAGSAGEARAMAAGAPDGAGRAAWTDGALWYFASGGTVQGDEDPTFQPGDVEAFDRFIRAFRPAGGAA